MLKVSGSERIDKSIYNLLPSTSVGQVLPLWFSFRQFNELLSCSEPCAVPCSIHAEGPIASVVLLLSAPQWCLPAMQASHSLPTPSLLLPSTSEMPFPRARLSSFRGRQRSSPPFRGLQQTLLQRCREFQIINLVGAILAFIASAEGLCLHTTAWSNSGSFDAVDVRHQCLS